MDNFGMNKMSLPAEFKDIEVTVVHRDNDMVYIYNKEGRMLLYFRATCVTQCSSTDIGHFYGRKELLTPIYLKACSIVIQKLYAGKTVISRQNCSKEGYPLLLSLGFVDMYRVRGNYMTNGNNFTGAKENSNSCISLMMLGEKMQFLPAVKRTLDLMKVNYPELFVEPVPVVKEVPKPAVISKPKDKIYICMAPTSTLTAYKLYKGVKCALEDSICVVNDNGNTITIKEGRFILTS